MISASSVRAMILSTTLFVRARRIIWPTSVPAPTSKPSRKQGGTAFGQLALRKLLSGSGHASGCPELRPASANQPVRPRWPAMQALVST